MQAARASDPLDTLTPVVHVTKAVGDALRANILKILGTESFGVIELGTIFSMAQPAMSHHLKILHEAGLVTKRKEGTSIFYQRVNPESQGQLADVLAPIFRVLDGSPIDGATAEQIELIYQQRQQQTQDYFANHKDALATQQEMICSPLVYRNAVLDAAQLTQSHDSALEIGPGDGTLLASLAEHFRNVTAIEQSPAMLAPITELRKTGINIQQGDFFALKHKQFDLIVAAMVVHHMPSPARFFRHTAALLHQDGQLVLAELCAHPHQWTHKHCGDLWLGFAPEQLSQWARAAGLNIVSQQYFAQRNGFTVQVLALNQLRGRFQGTGLASRPVPWNRPRS